MDRVILATAVFFSLISTATAALSPRKDEPRPAGALFLHRTEKPTPPGQVGQFRITRSTEILLNGRPCRYEDVPTHATVIRLEVEPDGKTAIRVHFRTRK
jgi:hypothetical protein